MEQHRPDIHFLPPSGWMNDPNGIICVDGVWHMFYQYNPHSALWYRIHWGHATSRDMIHWEHQPIALYPDTPGLDEAGCWSGCAVLHDDQIWLFYTAATGDVAEDGIETGYFNQSIGLVRGTREGKDWKKLPTPLIDRADFPPNTIAVRDPLVYRDGDGWRMTIGAGIRDKGGAALLYRSDDLLHWEYEGILHQGTPGEAWECPQLLTFDNDRAALLVNIWHPPHRSYSAYFSGTYRDGKFKAEFFSRLEMEHSALFAPQANRAPDGRWMLWGWLREEREIPARVAAGWSGVMSLPRVVTMGNDGRLRMMPVREMEAQRTGVKTYYLPSTADSAVNLEPILSGETFEAHAYEIDSEVIIQTDDLWMRLDIETPNEVHKTVDSLEILFNQYSQLVTMHRENANGEQVVETRPLKAPLSQKPGDILKLRVFVDRSVVELFCNDGSVCAATRIYPTTSEDPIVGLQVDGGVIGKFEIHALASIGNTS